jgi:hypothetical protein
MDTKSYKIPQNFLLKWPISFKNVRECSKYWLITWDIKS